MSQEKEGLLNCIECGINFFTAGEKEFYKSKGLNIPKRCKECRIKKGKRHRDRSIVPVHGLVSWERDKIERFCLSFFSCY